MATKRKQRKRRVIVQGRGNSKPHISSEPKERAEKVLTVNGEPIPAEFAHAIPYGNTDQGIAEFNDQEFVRDDAGQVKIIADEFDQTIRARTDAVEPYEMPDPMKEIVEAHVKPGFRGRFLAPRVIEKRGLRGYEIVKNDKGDPIRLANMVLGVMPEEKARRRNKYYQQQGEDRLRKATEQFQEGQERLSSATEGVRPLVAGETVQDHQTHQVAQIGLRSSRGNSNV